MGEWWKKKKLSSFRGTAISTTKIRNLGNIFNFFRNFGNNLKYVTVSIFQTIILLVYATYNQKILSCKNHKTLNFSQHWDAIPCLCRKTNKKIKTKFKCKNFQIYVRQIIQKIKTKRTILKNGKNNSMSSFMVPFNKTTKTWMERESRILDFWLLLKTINFAAL